MLGNLLTILEPKLEEQPGRCDAVERTYWVSPSPCVRVAYRSKTNREGGVCGDHSHLDRKLPRGCRGPSLRETGVRIVGDHN